MPEGDTVYQTAHRLDRVLTGKVLLRGQLRHPRLSTVDLAGREVLGARSVGKHLFVRFDRSLSLHNHLGMDGSWQTYLGAPVRWRHPAHRARVVLTADGAGAIGFNLLEMALVDTAQEHRLVAHLGPDLLDPDWSPEHAVEAAGRLAADGGREIGVALLDQRVMAGVGNVFKAELCFLLGVSPWTPVSDVDVDRAVSLSRELLLRNADKVQRNTTGDPRRGNWTWVYGRTREGCLRCRGPVGRRDQGPELRERITYFCRHCQPGPY